MNAEHLLVINHHQLLLLADKALYWPQQKALLIADVHFGKAAAYRALGQPVPRGTTSANLQRINDLIQHYPTRQLIFLGDFLHAPGAHAASTLLALRNWRKQNPAITCILVRGNHDVKAGDPPSDLDIKVVTEPYLVEDFSLQHMPKPHETHHVIAGHIHPTFRLMGKGRQSLILPCFYHEPTITIMPSFGDFTGGFIMNNGPDKKIFVTDSQCVWPIYI